MILKFFKFFLAAKTKYQVHSPFVFEFINNILEDDREFYSFTQVENLRQLLLQDQRKIQVSDFGAGSKKIKSNQRKVRSIAKTALSSPFFCRILFRIVNHYKPKTMLEIGTSLGVSTLYQHFAARNAKMISLEGCPEISKIASQNFNKLKAENIKLLTGNFAETLPKALNELQKLDYVFLDGNHRKAPTLSYFDQCVQYAHSNSIFIIDDIHWSDEMQAAWQEIKSHEKVRLSIDLFFIGIVFFREEQKVKEHFKLVPWWWKPWRMGFFR